MSLIEKHAQIENRDTLIEFFEAFQHDYDSNQDDWENVDLRSFLEAMKVWVQDMDGYYENTGRKMPSTPSWQMIGDIMMGARIYE